MPHQPIDIGMVFYTLFRCDMWISPVGENAIAIPVERLSSDDRRLCRWPSAAAVIAAARSLAGNANASGAETPTQPSPFRGKGAHRVRGSRYRPGRLSCL